MLSFSHIEGSIPDFGPFSSLEKMYASATGYVMQHTCLLHAFFVLLLSGVVVFTLSVLESTGIWTGESTGLTGTIEGVSNLKNLRIL